MTLKELIKGMFSIALYLIFISAVHIILLLTLPDVSEEIRLIVLAVITVVILSISTFRKQGK